MFECREKSPHWPGLDSWWKFGCFWQFEQYTCKNKQAWMLSFNNSYINFFEIKEKE